MVKKELMTIAREAGAVILDVYRRDFTAAHKADRSPVTEADTAAEAVILAGLAKLAPGIPVIAEEQAAKDGLPDAACDRFFLVDPLDGTKEFVAKNGEFTVNIALIEHGRAVSGVVYLPALDICYAADRVVIQDKGSLNMNGPLSLLEVGRAPREQDLDRFA